MLYLSGAFLGTMKNYHLLFDEIDATDSWGPGANRHILFHGLSASGNFRLYIPLLTQMFFGLC
jgi:hypothetical protein